MGMEPQIDIMAFKDGEQKEFEKVFNGYFTQLLYFAVKMTDNFPESEDIVMVSFEKLYERCYAFDTQSSIKAFLFITVKNRCLNYLKKRKRWFKYTREAIRKTPKEKEAEALLQLPYKELTKKFLNAIESLPPDCKLIYKLWFFEDMTVKEIAKKLGKKTGTILSQRTRARRLIRERL
jgi:RNA polymerase sigma-70 factor (ECF subfamily)